MPLSHLSLQDRALFWQFGQGPEVPVPDPLVHHAVERRANAAPHTVAAEHQGTTITYGELNRRADRLAAGLVREGVRPGDHVGLFVRRSIPMLVGLLGTLKAGCRLRPAGHRPHPRRPAAARHPHRRNPGRPHPVGAHTAGASG